MAETHSFCSLISSFTPIPHASDISFIRWAWDSSTRFYSACHTRCLVEPTAITATSFTTWQTGEKSPQTLWYSHSRRSSSLPPCIAFWRHSAFSDRIYIAKLLKLKNQTQKQQELGESIIASFIFNESRTRLKTCFGVKKLFVYFNFKFFLLLGWFIKCLC